MQLSEIRLDESMRELTVRGEPGYPIAIYDNDMDGFLGGSVPWHWHREVELCLVREGRMLLEAGDQSRILEPGQGGFINGGVLHRMAREDRVCRMITVAFDPLLISGAETSVIHSRYILPLLRCQALSSVFLTREADWQRAAAARLERAAALDRRGGFGCEPAIRQLMTEIWLDLLRENGALLERQAREPGDRRLKQMLRYLQSHISEPVRLEDVAAAAGVSPRECTRCFRTSLGVTPISYLTQLRVRSAAARLERTDDSVTEVALAAGFDSPGYFARVFRRQTGLAPRDYRRAKRAGPPAGEH